MKLQMVALTDHSCGDGEELDEQVVKQLELLANEGEDDSGIESSVKNDEEDIDSDEEEISTPNYLLLQQPNTLGSMTAA